MACLTLLVGGSLGGLWFGYRSVMRSGAIDVREVSVSGAAQVGPELADYLRLGKRTPLSSIDAEQLARRLERHPWVKSAEVEKSYPHKLVLNLVEREPALLHLAGKLYLVDREGVWIKAVQPGDAFDLPVVTGVAAAPATAATAKLRRLADFAAYWDAATSPVRIGELRYVNDSEVLVYTLGEATAIALPLDPEKWAPARDRLGQVMREARKMGLRMKSLDMQYPDRAIAQTKI